MEWLNVATRSRWLPVILVGLLVMMPFPAWAQDATKEVKLSIHPELREHTRQFEKKIYKIADNVYSAVGWDLANTIMVEGPNGVVIVDTGGRIDSARAVASELKKITAKPVVAIVYTHFHPDHINGVKAYTSEDDVKAGSVAIFAHEMLLKEVENQSGTIGPILSMRTASRCMAQRRLPRCCACTATAFSSFTIKRFAI
jgi:alkyl sulfatase BDS1-like metallo-beta-lactamase superfamily hydrolase